MFGGTGERPPTIGPSPGPRPMESRAETGAEGRVWIRIWGCQALSRHLGGVWGICPDGHFPGEKGAFQAGSWRTQSIEEGTLWCGGQVGTGVSFLCTQRLFAFKFSHLSSFPVAAWSHPDSARHMSAKDKNTRRTYAFSELLCSVWLRRPSASLQTTTSLHPRWPHLEDTGHRQQPENPLCV